MSTQSDESYEERGLRFSCMLYLAIEKMVSFVSNAHTSTDDEIIRDARKLIESKVFSKYNEAMKGLMQMIKEVDELAEIFKAGDERVEAIRVEAEQAKKQKEQELIRTRKN